MRELNNEIYATCNIHQQSAISNQPQDTQEVSFGRFLFSGLHGFMVRFPVRHLRKRPEGKEKGKRILSLNRL